MPLLIQIYCDIIQNSILKFYKSFRNCTSLTILLKMGSRSEQFKNLKVSCKNHIQIWIQNFFVSGKDNKVQNYQFQFSRQNPLQFGQQNTIFTLTLATSSQLCVNKLWRIRIYDHPNICQYSKNFGQFLEFSKTIKALMWQFIQPNFNILQAYNFTFQFVTPFLSTPGLRFVQIRIIILHFIIIETSLRHITCKFCLKHSIIQGIHCNQIFIVELGNLCIIQLFIEILILGGILFILQLQVLKVPTFVLKCESELARKSLRWKKCYSCYKDTLFLNNYQTRKCISMRLFIYFIVPNNLHEIFILEVLISKDFQKGDQYIDFTYFTKQYSEGFMFGNHKIFLGINREIICLLPIQLIIHIILQLFILIQFLDVILKQWRVFYQTSTIIISQYSLHYQQLLSVLDRKILLKINIVLYRIINYYLLFSPFFYTVQMKILALNGYFDNTIIKLDPFQCCPQQFFSNQYFRFVNFPQECLSLF
ncbi:unnamed protein product [Paramecium octaurelia]|uniref:Transmembrane protein n=1 Tax=Paramecium octaurelia TaxID=43137 RepID=A0A8S1YK82_PAROT|nr:unnamed protein product [Paramecium octaurelia]